MEKVQSFKNVELKKLGDKSEEDFSKALTLPKIRKDFIAKLEHSLMFLDFKSYSMYHSEAIKNYNFNTFDGAWLLDVSLKHGETDNFAFAPFGELQVTPDMFPNHNIKFLNMGGDVAQLNKFRFLGLKEKRNLENFRYIYSQRFAFLDHSKQQWFCNEDGYGFNKIETANDFKCIMPTPTPLSPGYLYNPADVLKHVKKDNGKFDDWYVQSLQSFHMSLQLALTYDYEWSCYIKEKPDSLGVRIPIHPSSSKEVFIMRNIPEGKKRKRAIVNFVKDHYRTIKGNGNERKVLIQKHLRGDLKFNWRGLEVHITPSPYDLRKYKTNKNFKSFK